MTKPLDKRVGLALGGGASRGWAHIGVVRALEEAGHIPAWVGGTSMGALVAAAVAAGRLDALEAFARSLTQRKVISYLDLVMPVRGLLGGEKIAALLTELLGDVEISELSIPFCAVATDLATGREVRLREGPLVDAVMASIAIPGIFNPQVVGDDYLVDGGLVNPVPVSVLRDMGATQVIAVDLNHEVVECQWCGPEGPSPDAYPQGRLPPAPGATEAARTLTLAASRGVSETIGFDMIERRYRQLETDMKQRAFNWIMHAARPHIFDVIGNSISVVEVMLTRSNLSLYPPDVLIQPSLGNLSLWEFDEAVYAIDKGYETARSVLSARVA
ncbi:MAG: patatin-like phospholipase family protein [Leptospirillia bacterium]